MNHDSPFESYLNDRAAGIDAPGAGPNAIAHRARARRRRRRAGSGAVLGAAVLLAGAVAGQGLRSDDDSQKIASYGAGIVDPVLDWTVVDVEEGLGWTRDMAEVGSGDLYGISTAPGPYDDERQLQSRLYRSGDGSEWSEVPLPGGLSPNDLAADGDAVVAVGTSAAGGDVRVQLARSTSPDEGWSVRDVPLDLDDAAADFPGRLYVAETATAVHDGRTVVAVNVLADVDVAEVLPGEGESGEWYATTEGMERSVAACDADGSTATTAAPTDDPEGGPGTISSRSEEEAATEAAADGDPTGSYSEGECAGGGQQEVRTWAELGYGEEIARLVGGQTHIFAADADGDLQPGTVIDRGMGFDTSLLAGDDGFWLVAPAYAETETVAAHRSVDGTDWSEPAVEVPGAMLATGVLDGRVAVLASDWVAGRLTVHALSGAGVESHDLTDLAGLSPEGTRYPAAAGIGPLGVAVVIGTHEAGQRGSVLHSADGVEYSRTELPAPPDGKRQTVNGMTMSADAVKVRLNVRDGDDLAGEGPPDQRLLVGTPR